MTKKAEGPWAPTAQQERFVRLLLDPDEPRSIRQACKETPVNITTVYRIWRKNPQFVAYFNAQRNEGAKLWLASVDAGIRRKAEGGDAQAAKLAYERFDPNYVPKSERKNIQAVEDMTEGQLDAILEAFFAGYATRQSRDKARDGGRDSGQGKA